MLHEVDSALTEGLDCVLVKVEPPRVAGATTSRRAYLCRDDIAWVKLELHLWKGQCGSLNGAESQHGCNNEGLHVDLLEDRNVY